MELFVWLLYHYQEAILDSEVPPFRPMQTMALNTNGMLMMPLSQFSVHKAQNHNFHLTAAMVVLFLICWTPYFIATIVHFADTDLYTGRRRNLIRIPAMLKTVLYIFATFNSCANPYLCAYFSNRLRKQVSELVRAVGSLGSLSAADVREQSRRRPRAARGHDTYDTRRELNAVRRAHLNIECTVEMCV